MKRSGFALIILHLTALLVAYLVMNSTKTKGTAPAVNRSYVQQAQNAGDAINNRIQQSELEP